MCRSRDESGRRCPCDTSAARQARRINARAMGSVATLQRPAKTPQKPQEAPSAPEPSKTPLETAHARLEEIRDKGKALREKYYASTSTADIGEMNEFAQEAGQAVADYAEVHAGVTHEEVETAYAEERASQERTREILRELRKSDPPQELWAQRNAELDREKEINERIKSGRIALGEGYRAALAISAGEEIGTGKDGITISDLATKRHKDAQRDLNEAVDCYPVSWVEASNKRGDLLPRISTARAHYVNARRVGTSILDNLCMVHDEDYKHPRLVRLTEEELDDIEEAREANGQPGLSIEQRMRLRRKVRTTYYKRYEHGPLDEKTGLPRGNGWEHAEDEYGNAYIVKRSMPRNASKKVKRAAEITIPPGTDRDHNATAVHEFAHRCEMTMPVIARMEGHFLDQRKGDGERLVAVSGGGSRSEMGYADSFAHSYSGRVYNGSNFEIMSTGAEDLFGRNSGVQGTGDKGFMWNKEGKMDSNFRNFVLGTMSFVKPPQD